MKVGVSLLHRDIAISWYVFGVSWLNSRAVGCGLKSLVCTGLWLY